MDRIRGKPEAGEALGALPCIALAILVWALAAPGPACAGTFINIVTGAVTLTPTPADYDRDYVEATGASGLAVKVKNTGSSGLSLLVRSATAGPAIAPGDLLVRTTTPPGPGGTTLGVYTVLGATNMLLWSSGIPQGPFVRINMDVRVRNLWSYDDAGGAGTTSYTNTLVFTVVEP